MFSKNLKYYRLKSNLTKASLASMVGVSPMAITHYENGDRRPDMPTVKALADVLGVKIADFLAVRNANLVFTHEEFRKNSKLSKSQQEYVREAVEEYFSRFFEAVESLGGEVLPESPQLHTVPVSGDPEADGIGIRPGKAVCRRPDGHAGKRTAAAPHRRSGEGANARIRLIRT